MLSSNRLFECLNCLQHIDRDHYYKSGSSDILAVKEDLRRNWPLAFRPLSVQNWIEYVEGFMDRATAKKHAYWHMPNRARWRKMNDNDSSSLLDRRLAYVVFRLSVGVNILIHGLARFLGAGPESFASETARELAAVPLPQGMIRAFLVTLPYAESIVGIFITVGLFTRWALAIGGLLIVALIFGTALRADWPTVGIQMIYAITYYLLLVSRLDNAFSVDGLVHRR